MGQDVALSESQSANLQSNVHISNHHVVTIILYIKKFYFLVKVLPTRFYFTLIFHVCPRNRAVILLFLDKYCLLIMFYSLTTG